MSFLPPVPNTDLMSGQRCYVALDVPLSTPPSSAYKYAEVLERGFGAQNIDLVADGIAIVGPRTFTLDLLGVKIPCKVSVTINDTTSGYPGTDTTTDYDFGPSLTSQSITLPDSNYAFTRLVVSRRF